LQEGEARRVGDSRARRVDVRVVAATHRALERGVAQGTFRADLYFRLAAVRLRLPSLRERGRDVLLLARHFLALAAARAGGPPPELAPELSDRLLRHAWPGNVRELAHVARPGVAEQAVRQLGCQLRWRPARARRREREKVAREEQHVAAALAERRQPEPDRGEAKVEVGSKRPLRHAALERAMGGGDHAHVHAPRPRVSDPSGLALLE